MQTIYIDIANKGVIPTINAKQGDVGRKFEVCFSDSGVQYQIPNGAAFSAFYSGASGEGNYTDIGQRSAFTINGNSVIVELIEQMLVNHGDGVLCLVLGIPGGASIGTWNIPYQVEIVPGQDSEEAAQYYTAFSEAVKNLPYPDTTLSVENKAADAAAVGKALAQKAPAGYGLGADGRIVTDCNLATANGWYIAAGVANAPSGMNYGWMHVSSRYGTMVRQDYYTSTTPAQHWVRYCNNDTWGEWACKNPPMVAGTEYRTTERWNGKPVYKQTISLGKLPESTTKFENLLIADEVVDFSFTTTDNASEKFIHNNKVTALGRAWSSQYIYATIELNSVLSQYYGYLTISYTKL